MNRQTKKRLRLFKTFSQNLEWVKEGTNNFTNVEFTDGYMCPICLKLFPIQNLYERNQNDLTLEDVPPASLGGKPITLTCRDCNSKSGHQLDIDLLERLLELDFGMWLPGSKVDTRFKIGENEMAGSFGIEPNGTIRIDLQPKRSHPKQAGKFLGDLITTHKMPLNPFNIDKVLEGTKMSFTQRLTSDEHRAEIALLRIAYLLAFCTFGYGLILNNPGLNLVRQQVLNPEEDILQTPYWIKYDFGDEWNGVNIIKEPKELRCFLVIFDLKTKSKIRKFAIALPGHSPQSKDIYKNIQDILGTENTVHSLTIEHLTDGTYIDRVQGGFASHIYWKEYFGA